MNPVCSRWSARARALGGLVLATTLPLAAAAQDKPAQRTPTTQPADKPPTTQPALADPSGTYKADPVHSSNAFRIKHANIAEFYGRFNDLSGEYTLSSADPAACKFEFQIKTASIDTRNEQRDNDLRSEKFFDVEKFPTITFKSTKVQKAADDKYDVTGELTLHGVTKPLTTQICVTGAGPAMRGQIRSGLETKFTIDRRDFGITTYPGMLGDEVLIAVSIEGVRQ